MTPISLDRGAGMYPLALQALRLLPAPLALMVVGLTLLEVVSMFLSSGAGLAFGRLFLQMIWFFAVHRLLLSGGAVTNSAAMTTAEGKLSWKFLGFLVLSVLPAVAITLAILLGTDALASLDMASVLPVIGAAFLAYMLTLTLVGTVFPSIADTGKAHIGAELNRGLRHAGPTFLRLLAGPLVVHAAAFGGLLWLAGQGVPVDVIDEFGQFSVVGTVIAMLAYLLSAYAMALVAVILCRVYRSEVAPDADIFD